jgi:hypothetical protein
MNDMCPCSPNHPTTPKKQNRATETNTVCRPTDRGWVDEGKNCKKWGPAATRTRGLSQVVLWVNPKRAETMLDGEVGGVLMSNLQSYH